jgi:hypothetical protein
MKLGHQFKSGGTGGKRVHDTVGAGSEDRDEKAKALIPKDVKARARRSIRDMLVGKPGCTCLFRCPVYIPCYSMKRCPY